MVQSRDGKLPHIKWLDLKNDNTFNECVVMKIDQNENIYYFQVNELDTIDKRRLSRILHGRHAASMELWDLMSQVTLNNGINALTYFHQLVKVITPGGTIYTPRTGVVGGPGTLGKKFEPGRVQIGPQSVPVAPVVASPLAAQIVTEHVELKPKKKPGRPKRKTAAKSPAKRVHVEAVASPAE
ncbi:MAG: hypothetical protein ACREAU_01730 [Nitrosopumilaceae archaeon]